MKRYQPTTSRSIHARTSRNGLALALAIGCSSLSVISAEAFDWPQWQGPNRDAMSEETGLLQEWPAGGPSMAWKSTNLGGGDSTPSIVNGRIFGMSHRDGEEVIWALSEKDGSELWVNALGTAYEQSRPQSKEGPGSTPTIDGDRLYAIGLEGKLVCLRVEDGKLLWERDLVNEFGGNIPVWSYRESPLIDGDQLICTPGGDEITIAALNKLTGETIWTSFVPDEPGGQPIKQDEQPTVIQTDLLLSSLDADDNGEISIVEWEDAPAVLAKLDSNNDGKLAEDELTPNQDEGSQRQGRRGRRGGGVMRMMKAHAALDANESGDIDSAEIAGASAVLGKLDENGDGSLNEDEAGPRFRAPKNSGAGYSSAIAIEFGGVRQYVQFTAKTVAGMAAEDGKLLWRYDRPANGFRINISTPVYHDGHVFAASAYNNGGGLARLIKQDDGSFVAEEVWFSTNMENHHGGVLIIDGAVYGANGGNGGGYLACLDFATGDVLWNEADRDKRRLTKGSVAYADGRIYYRTEEGPVVLIEPNRMEYLERGRFEQPDRTGSPAWAHPVVANGKLYIRDQDTLYCYDVKKPGA